VCLPVRSERSDSLVPVRISSCRFWDYTTGYGFQATATKVQPGSLESEAGILSMAFDATGSRLFTTEADKSIKVWKEDPDASPETHPIDMKAWTDYYRSHKKY
jgi:pleiotropic regulator 1